MRKLIIIIATIALMLFSSCEEGKCIKSHKETIAAYNYYGTQETDMVTITICDSSIKIK